MIKKVIAASLVLIVVLTLAACKGEELTSVEEIVAGILDSQHNIETYQMDMDMSMSMAIEAEGETFEIQMGMDGSGSVDVKNTKMEMVLHVNMNMAGMGNVEIAEYIYLMDNMMYIGVDMPLFLEDSMWMKSQMPEEILYEMDQVEAIIVLIETAQINVLGSEKVNGVDCYVIEVIPDVDQLWELVSQQLQHTGNEMDIPDIAEETIRDVLDSYSVDYYIAKDTYFLIRATIDMSVELTPADLGIPEEGSMTMDITMNLLAYDYNEPVSIELPPEAEDAIEVPSGDFPW